jgi:hypothetical protein
MRTNLSYCSAEALTIDLCRDSLALLGFSTTYKTAGTANYAEVGQDIANCGLGCGSAMPDYHENEIVGALRPSRLPEPAIITHCAAWAPIRPR